MSNMDLWNAVSETDPNYTKHVGQRGGFTAISANYQIMQATKQFGEMGKGWGYITGDPIFQETLIFVPVTLWHGDRANSFGPLLGCEEWKDKNGRVDSDASKKATTDAITKLLSQLGFSADVFLGRYDDQKYVDDLRTKYAEKLPEPEPAPVITEDQRTELMGMLDTMNVPVGPFLQVGNISDLSQLPADQFDLAKRWINKQAAKRAEQKETA